MDTFLINRNSPLRSGVLPKLRHRSPSSISEESMSHGDEETFRSGERYEPNDADQSPDKELEDTAKAMSKSMLSYFMSELTKGYKLEADASAFVERRDRIYTSVNTPKNLEKFCAFGFLQCLDSILYMVTFLPLRLIAAIIRIIIFPLIFLFNGNTRALNAAQTCDLLKGVILVISCFVTSYMDMSMIYHIVRGQSIIKFYVFYNMLDVMDKLISGFGQDVLDSLYWTAVEPRGRRREHFGTFFHLVIAVLYVIIHTVMILIQAIILNVAFNSHNKNLLTIMMSNNFIEIKGNLFKRLDKNNLCQVSYSDVKERFHYLVLLLFVFIRNMKELQWNWDLAYPIIQDSAIVLFAEVIVDWIKHAFITKFNELSASSYADFALGLAQDIACSQQKHAFSNFNDQVCRRMGFTPIPLICLLFMVCSKSFNISGPIPWLLVALLYLCLISSKVLNSIILLGWAQRLLDERDKNAKSTATVVDSQVVPKKEDKGSAQRPRPEAATKPDLIDEMKRTRTVSSNVAVNTDTSFSADTHTEMYMEDIHGSKPDKSNLTPSTYSQYNSAPLSTDKEEGFISKENLTINTDITETLKENPPQKYTSASPVIPVSLDFQTDFYTADVELANSLNNSPMPSVSPSKTTPLVSNSQFLFDLATSQSTSQSTSQLTSQSTPQDSLDLVASVSASSPLAQSGQQNDELEIGGNSAILTPVLQTATDNTASHVVDSTPLGDTPDTPGQTDTR